MIYELRHFDTPLVRFSATEGTSTPEIDILWTDPKQKKLLPLDLELSGEGLSRWLRHRTIPKNRAYVQNFLSKCGLSLNRPLDVIKVSKGLSLNDCYWVVEEGFDGTFSQYNLYDNRFSRVLALIAFTGYGSSVRSSLASCPEFTTNGMLPKCWRRVDGDIRLYKGGTKGASNSGMPKVGARQSTGLQEGHCRDNGKGQRKRQSIIKHRVMRVRMPTFAKETPYGVSLFALRLAKAEVSC